MIQPDCLLATLPLTDDAVPHIWAVESDRLSWTGSLDLFRDEYAGLDIEDIPSIAIVPASISAFRIVERRGLELKQELAVARLEAQQEAIGTVLSATGLTADDRIVVATANSAAVEAGLDRLAALGFWVKAAIPAASVVAPPEGEVWRVDLGGDVFLRSADFACPDEPALRTALFAGTDPVPLGEAQSTAAIIAACNDPKPDFLEGRPRKRKSQPLFSETNRFWLGRLAAVAAILIVVSGIAYWSKLQWEIAQENKRALAAAQTLDPSITDIEQADAALARRADGGDQASMLTAIVWQSAKASENVAINDLRVGGDGLLAATLTAPDAPSVNAVLIAIQRAGYRITATPRRDASGATLVDLTVRAP